MRLRWKERASIGDPQSFRPTELSIFFFTLSQPPCLPACLAGCLLGNMQPTSLCDPKACGRRAPRRPLGSRDRARTRIELAGKRDPFDEQRVSLLVNFLPIWKFQKSSFPHHYLVSTCFLLLCTCRCQKHSKTRV